MRYLSTAPEHRSIAMLRHTEKENCMAKETSGDGSDGSVVIRPGRPSSGGGSGGGYGGGFGGNRVARQAARSVQPRELKRGSKRRSNARPRKRKPPQKRRLTLRTPRSLPPRRLRNRRVCWHASSCWRPWRSATPPPGPRWIETSRANDHNSTPRCKRKSRPQNGRPPRTQPSAGSFTSSPRKKAKSTG